MNFCLGTLARTYKAAFEDDIRRRIALPLDQNPLLRHVILAPGRQPLLAASTYPTAALTRCSGATAAALLLPHPAGRRLALWLQGNPAGLDTTARVALMLVGLPRPRFVRERNPALSELAISIARFELLPRQATRPAIHAVRLATATRGWTHVVGDKEDTASAVAPEVGERWDYGHRGCAWHIRVPTATSAFNLEPAQRNSKLFISRVRVARRDCARTGPPSRSAHWGGHAR